MRYLATIMGILAFFSMLRSDTYQVSMVDYAFIPQQLTVYVGDTVTWVNNGSSQHTTTSGAPCLPDGIWDSGFLEPGDSFSFVFESEGIFPYSCLIWCCCGMTGEIQVEHTGVEEREITGKLRTQIKNVSPIPALDRFFVNYEIERRGEVEISLFSSSGAFVTNLFRGIRDRGSHNLSVKLNRDLPSGVYSIVLSLDGRMLDVGRVVITKSH